MSSVNKALIIGNLGQDPDIKYTQSGSPVANLSVATSERWKDKNTGEQKEQTEWHRVVVFGRLAEIAEQYLKKGSKIFIEGKIQTRDWEDAEGNKRYTTEVVAREMTMLDSRSSMGSDTPSSSDSSVKDVAKDDNTEEDIPF
tara:strand:- start:1175 stop:1600 length:426 start_codon:yes stop_codon:yes gene_type:complete